MTRRRVAVLGLLAAALVTCKDGEEPPTSGWVDVRLTSPTTDDGGVMFLVSAVSTDSVRSTYPTLLTRPSGALSRRVIVAGNLAPGTIAQIFFPSLGDVDVATLTLEQVSARTFEQRDPNGYTLTLVRP